MLNSQRGVINVNLIEVILVVAFISGILGVVTSKAGVLYQKACAVRLVFELKKWQLAYYTSLDRLNRTPRTLEELRPEKNGLITELNTFYSRFLLKPKFLNDKILVEVEIKSCKENFREDCEKVFEVLDTFIDGHVDLDKGSLRCSRSLVTNRCRKVEFEL